MKTTKVLSIVLAVLLVFSFAACSSLPAEPTKPDTQTEAPATTETPADKPVEEPIETLADEPVEEPSETPEEPVEIVRNTIKLPGVPDAVSAVPDVVLPLTNEEVSFEFWLISQALLVRYGHTDADEWKVIREMKNRTGINVEFTIPSDYSTQFGIMMASGDMPDLIEQFKVYYRYGMDHAIDEELILPLEEYREYLPHLFAIIDSSDLIHNQCYTDAGHMPGIPFMKVDHEGKNEGSWAGFVVRQDWLDELNMEVPTTYSELDVVLSAIQENYPTAEHPLMIQCRGGNFVYDAGAVFHKIILYIAVVYVVLNCLVSAYGVNIYPILSYFVGFATGTGCRRKAVAYNVILGFAEKMYIIIYIFYTHTVQISSVGGIR